MEFEEKNLDILQNLEFSVVVVWREHPEMTDYSVLRVFETALQIYRDEARGHAPKPHALTGLDMLVFDALKSVCEWRLGRRACPTDGAEMPEIPPVPLDQLLECLRRLIKSVKRHTETGGRQGYLEFIDKFLP